MFSLSKSHILLLTCWVCGLAQTAHSEKISGTNEVSRADNDQPFWAFEPVQRPPLPKVTSHRGLQAPIDFFVRRRLEEHGLTSVGLAKRSTLIRRATFDLTGLPPTPDAIDAFLHTDAPNAYARLLDRLLASPHYGPRWARHWLDVARYGDNIRKGGSLCAPLDNAFRYRDWVVEAFNADLPFDRFVMLQIAGDLMPGTVQNDWRAVGFFATGPTFESDGGDPVSRAKAKAESLDDKMDAFSRGFLGLTVSCARCHDHKFDPISSTDYYALAGVFHNTSLVEIPFVNPEVVQQYDQAVAQVEEKTKRITDAEKNNSENTDLINHLRIELKQLEAQMPPKYPTFHSLTDVGSEDMQIAIGGNPMHRGDRIPRRMLRAVSPQQGRLAFDQGSGRLQLAQSLVQTDNPLTSRVMVNRIWQHHFGRGIVNTPDNFGQLGARPSHLPLLNWLASRLMENRWSIKNLHRDIMLSGTYQLSSRYDPAQYAGDSDNRWLGRANRRRMEVEAWRDTLLFVTGSLDPSIGGPPDTDLLTGHRRSIYGFVSRDSATESDRFLKLFDFPDANISHSKRAVTIVPQQWLFAMNSEFIIRLSKSFCKSLDAHSDHDTTRIRHAFRQLYGRSVQPDELAMGQNFLAAHRTGGLTLWEQYCQVLLASSELMYVE